MFRFHTALLTVLAIAIPFACTVPVPQPPRLTIAIDAKGRVEAPPPARVDVKVRADLEAEVDTADVQTGAEVQTESEDEVEAAAYVEAEIEPAWPTTPVALEGSTVVEFFGIPLDGAQDVVFVLDRSGSMEDFAIGQIAQLGNTASLPAQPAAPMSSPAQAPPFEDAQPEPRVPEADAELPAQSPPLKGPRKIDVAHAELVDALERLPAGTRMNVLFFNDRLEALEASIAPLDERNRGHVVGFVQATFPYGPTALAPAMRTAFLMNARRIILLSDGLGNVGGDAQSVLRDAREAMRGGVRIDTIGLGQDQDASLLGALARESGGIYQPL